MLAKLKMTQAKEQSEFISLQNQINNWREEANTRMRDKNEQREKERRELYGLDSIDRA